MKDTEADPRQAESEIVEALVAAAASGDRRAQEELLQKYWGLIESVIRLRRQRVGKQVRQREETADMQQDVALHVLRELPKHVWTQRRGFVAWLRKLADAKVIDAQRRHSAQRRDAGAETQLPTGDNLLGQRGPGVETLADEKRQVSTVEGLLGQIKPEYAIAVKMHFLGFSHQDISEVLACSSVEAARKLVARGLSRLQALSRLP